MCVCVCVCVLKNCKDIILFNSISEKEKYIVTLTPRAVVINVFGLYFLFFYNKLKCLSLTSFSSLVLSLLERLELT